jgi:periplasmic protein TonB
MLSLQWLGFAKPARPPTPAALQAKLLPPSEVPPPPLDSPPADQAVLKDTLPPAPPENAASESGKGAERSKRAAEAEAQRKLSQQVFYPPEAIAQGIEGEVRLLVALDPSGKVVQAKVVVSSGKDVLDKAAVAAAFRIGRIPEAGALDLILPVIFKLE